MAVLLPQPSTLMFMDRIEEGEAVIRSFTVPQKQSAISLSLSLLFIHTLSQTHIPQCTVSPSPMVPPPLHSIPVRAHLAITTAALPPQRNQFRPAPNRHGMLAKGDGVLSGSWLQPPSFPAPLLLPPRCFSTFPQHA